MMKEKKNDKLFITLHAHCGTSIKSFTDLKSDKGLASDKSNFF